jgi:hypothetical protein
MAFSYPPLSDTRAIRLLKFTGVYTDGVTLSFSLESSLGLIPNTAFIKNHPVLRVTSSDSCPSYHALSYVWGDASQKERIICNGAEVMVTKNLHQALTQLAAQQHHTPLWVDSLCINQGDNTEKSTQVAMMGDIYAAAQNVICWLAPSQVLQTPRQKAGTPQPDYQETFNEFHRIRALYPAHEELCPPCDECHHSLFSRSDRCNDETHCKTSAACPGLFYIVEQMGESPWFTRVWTFQELVRASKATLQIGPYALPWEDFAHAQLEMGRPFKSSMGTLFLPDNSEPRKKLEVGFLTNFRRNGARSLAAAIVAMKDRQSSVPLDKVFAAMGLSANLPSPMLPVDYSFTMDQLQTALTRFLVLGDGTPGVLRSLIGCGDRSKRHPVFPPWGIRLNVLEPAGDHLNIGKLPEISDSVNDLGLHCLLIGHAPRFVEGSLKFPLPSKDQPAPEPLPQCMTANARAESLPEHTHAIETGNSTVTPRLTVYKSSERGVGDRTARLENISLLVNTSNHPARLYEKYKAHQRTECGCHAECDKSESVNRPVYLVGFLANPAGWMTGQAFIIKYHEGSAFSVEGLLEWDLHWAGENNQVTETQKLYEFPLVLTTINVQ